MIPPDPEPETWDEFRTPLFRVDQVLGPSRFGDVYQLEAAVNDALKAWFDKMIQRRYTIVTPPTVRYQAAGSIGALRIIVEGRYR